jgi:hypothetical protein
MNSLPRNVGLLGGVVAFCAALLAGLLGHCPPLMAARKAALCAIALSAVAWLCAHVAVGVVSDGLRRRGQGEEP